MKSRFGFLAAGAIIALLSFGADLPAVAQATAFSDRPAILLGAAWYPEQWPETQWDADLSRMEAAHINLVRIAEFAWSAMEPSEGQFRFEWLDRAIALAEKHHMSVVLGTPTAAPPAWLTTKYPDTLRVDENGVRAEHGNRQQFSFTSPRYRTLAHAIAEKMAERYGHNPNVVGWQLDNEYAQASFDPESKARFHEWLRKKYGSIENLNNRWTTAYWSQTYDSFDEIPVRPEKENPGLLLDWKRFVSDTWKSYSENQIGAIRPLADKRQFITTNTMGWFAGFDEYVVHSNLDIAAWDDYVGGEHYDYFDNGARHDLTRGFKNRNFWVMETQPGFVNWKRTNSSLARGQVRDMAWQAIGHGADAVAYWQWRSAQNGQEQYHGVLAGADGTPVPVYAEVQQVGEEFAKASKALAGTSPQSSVALINDYDSRWAVDFQRHSGNFDPVVEMVAFYKPLRDQSQAVDVISARAPLTGYKLVVAPALNVLPKDVADRLLAYVQAGGNLVLGPRSGMKDEYNALNIQRQPGPLAAALGGRVEQFYAFEDKVPVEGEFGSGAASVWAEQLSVSAPDARVLARYGASNGWLDNQPAVITRRVGKGSITYVGAWLDEDLLAKLTSFLLNRSGVAPIVPNAPDGVEVCLRTGKGRAVLILINHNMTEVNITLPHVMTDLLVAGKAERNSVGLPGYGVAVLESK
jgi:beta-galactosidase